MVWVDADMACPCHAQATAKGHEGSDAASRDAGDAASRTVESPPVPHDAAEDVTCSETAVTLPAMHEAQQAEGQPAPVEDVDSVDGSVASSALQNDTEPPCPPVQLLTEDAPAVAAAAQAAGIEEDGLSTAVDTPRAAGKNKVIGDLLACMFISPITRHVIAQAVYSMNTYALAPHSAV